MKDIPYGGYFEGVFKDIRDVDELRLTRDVCCRVDYYSVDQRLTHLDYLGHLCICICALLRSYYPEYRLADIQATFVFSEEVT